MLKGYRGQQGSLEVGAREKERFYIDFEAFLRTRSQSPTNAGPWNYYNV